MTAVDRADTTSEGIPFPEGFLWGTSTAAHQIEGRNGNNDWWAWEHDPDSGCAESSGDACDSMHRWPDDIELVARMGLNAYRFSLEWSRIEPAEGEFSLAALDYYRRICAACHRARHNACRDLPPLHDPELAGRTRCVGGGRRCPTSSPASAPVPRLISGT